MGSLPTEDILAPERERVSKVRESSAEYINGDIPRSVEVAGLEVDRSSSPSGIRDELVLLSWLIVLLRTREDHNFSFEWAYKNREEPFDDESTAMRLVAGEVMAGLHSTVGDVAIAIAEHIKKATIPLLLSRSDSVSLVLSTGFLSPQPALHIEVWHSQGRLWIRPVWQSADMLPFSVTRHVESLVEAVRLCASRPAATISERLRPTGYDLDQIWGWNRTVPPTYDQCMHDVIAAVAATCPSKVAIDSWDGQLTYREVEDRSTALAWRLVASGAAGLHDFVPVCFEKSRWTVIALLAAMKAGAAVVLMDPTLPLARLQNMAAQVGAKTMLASCKQMGLAKDVLPEGRVFEVGEAAFAGAVDLAPPDAPKPPDVPPSALMYVIFTSGSTGTPKGVLISHSTYTSSAFPRAQTVGYSASSRVLDFASYAFDVSIDSMLLTLGNAGTLCIPSDEERLNDVNGAIERMRVNYAGITPSMARILDPDVIASLDGLGLGGEAASARDVNEWGRATRIIIGYGPCECTIGCTVNGSAARGRDYVTVGPGNGANIWVVDPSDHESLVPVGATGELLVEGPIVGQGYLNDPAKTAAAFVEDPTWLVAGHGEQHTGRRGRLYKTGDLGRYDPDGSGEIVFVERKDTQVKLRGQRVELGEIESQLKARLPAEASVVAEVIVPQAGGGQPTLVAFISPTSTKRTGDEEIVSSPLPEELRRKLETADKEVATVLPRYMVPTAYIPVNFVPTLISGKTDRKRLRQFGATVDLRSLDKGKSSDESRDRQLSDMELQLRQAWAATLKLEPDAIRLDDNFFALGGDSLAAMRLAAVCREDGLDLGVADAFKHPTLSSMSGVVSALVSRAPASRVPFSLIAQDFESACLEASLTCGVESTDIEDIYPCTPTQESLFTFSLKSAAAYVAQRVARIPPHVPLDEWMRAWEDVVARNPILRTRVVQLTDEEGLMQVVLRDGIEWRSGEELEPYLERDRAEKMNLGESLARYAIIDGSASDPGARHMVWTLHHTLYDGWSEPLVLEQVRAALLGQSPVAPASHMGDFVKYFLHQDAKSTQSFWRRELAGAVGPQFPHVPDRDFLSMPDTVIERRVPLSQTSTAKSNSQRLPVTLATLIRAAWSLVASVHSGSPDVVFGETLTGRDVALSGVEGVVGPLIATVPVRVRVDRAATVSAYLAAVQGVMLARAPHQHAGMQNIRNASRDAQYACEAPAGLVIQPEAELDVVGALGFEEGDAVREAIHFNPYSLMLACGIRGGGDGFRVCASFDSRLVARGEMEMVLAQLEMACGELAKDMDRLVGEVPVVPEEELGLIWQRNQTPPLALDRSSSQGIMLRAPASTKSGSAYPPVAVPWVCDPHNPALLVPLGCTGELCLEGNLLGEGGESVEDPTWLVQGSGKHAGRRGRVRRTGDIVKMNKDGGLVFMRRKEDAAQSQGHAVDVADLEGHFAKYLPSAVRAAAAVFQPVVNGEKNESMEELVVFVEQAGSEEAGVEILESTHDLVCNSADSMSFFKTTIRPSIPSGLAQALKRLDKFAQNSLASHLVPSAYVVVEKLPFEGAEIDRTVLNRLAASIPRQTLDSLRRGFEAAWKKNPAETKLSDGEDVLRSAWAKILGLAPAQIDVDDNFFRLGGNSVLAMKLVSHLRGQGHILTVADIFRHMRLGDAAKVLKAARQEGARDTPAYKPFSLLPSSDPDVFLSTVVRPQLADPARPIQDAYPVTDSQALDVRATVCAPRTSVQYTLLHFSGGVDRARLLGACAALVRAHDILRTVFVEHEAGFLQVVLQTLDVPVVAERAHGALEPFVAALCAARVESDDFRLGAPFLQLALVQGPGAHQHCLVVGLSHALYDGVSLPRLLRDLEALYAGGRLAPFAPFSSYIAGILSPPVQSKALAYWTTLLRGSSLSAALPGTLAKPGDKAVFKATPVPTASELPRETTTATLLTAAWSLVLARRLGRQDVVFGSVTSGRAASLPSLADMDEVVGPCYQLAPVRVSFGAQWTGAKLLAFVQAQGAESTAHDFVGFDAIKSKCGVRWADEEGWQAAFFGSVVHHQDWEDFGAMPFAGGECRVEIANPHGDAATPVKAVSFVKSGEVHVGVVGSERDKVLVDEVLKELVEAVKGLVDRPDDAVIGAANVAAKAERNGPVAEVAPGPPFAKGARGSTADEACSPTESEVDKVLCPATVEEAGGQLMEQPSRPIKKIRTPRRWVSVVRRHFSRFV